MKTIGYSLVKETAVLARNEVNCIEFCVKNDDLPVGGLALSFLCNGKARLSHEALVTDPHGLARVYVGDNIKEDVSVKAYYYDGDTLNFQYAIVDFV